MTRERKFFRNCEDTCTVVEFVSDALPVVLFYIASRRDKNSLRKVEFYDIRESAMDVAMQGLIYLTICDRLHLRGT